MAVTAMEDVREGRLTWPDHQARTGHRTRSPFRATLDRGLQELKWEIERWKPLDYIISRNNQRVYAGDPGVALWWVDRKTRELRVLACDKWDTMGANLHAIYLTLGAMRGVERWGAYSAEQAAQGARLRLPPPDGYRAHPARSWREILGVDNLPPMPADALLAIVQDRYRKQMGACNGEGPQAVTLNAAIEEARTELRA